MAKRTVEPKAQNRKAIARARAVMQAAATQLRALSEALDSINFPDRTGGAA